MSAALQKIQKAVEMTVGRVVSRVETVPVVESFHGKLVWKVIVEIFKVNNRPPERACGWIVAAEDGPIICRFWGPSKCARRCDKGLDFFTQQKPKI